MITVLGMVFERHGKEFPVVSGGFQPVPIRPSPATTADPCNNVSHATAFSDRSEVEVALRRSGLGGRARNRGRTRRHDDGGIRMALSDSLVHPVLIVGTVSREGG